MHAKNKSAAFLAVLILPLGVSPVIGFHTKKIMKCSGQIPSQEAPASLPTYCWMLLSSVTAIDFPGHVFIRSRTSSGLRCLAEQDGAAVSQFPFIPPDLSLHPISFASAVQAHIPQDSYQQDLTPEYQVLM